MLIDAKKFPRRKACGGCLNSVSVGLVEGLLPASSLATLWSDSIALKRFQIFHRARNFAQDMDNGGFAVDRAQLDRALVQYAQSLGVQFLSPATAQLGQCRTNHRCVDVVSNSATITYRAASVVIASGLSNRVAANYREFRQTPAKNSRVGVEAVFEQFPDQYRAGELNMAIGGQGYVGLTHIGDGRLHVAAAVDKVALQRFGPRGTVENVIRQSGAPGLLEVDAAWKGTPALTASAHSIAGDRVFLIGDAAGYVEPFTGEGIRWALESGSGVSTFLSSAVKNWCPSVAQDYRTWYRQTIAAQQKLCRRLTAGLKRPYLCWAAHQALRMRPSLADAIIKHLNHSAANC